MPDLRHGARTDDADRGGGRKPRAARNDPALLGLSRAFGTAPRHGDGRTFPTPRAPCSAAIANNPVEPAAARHPGRHLGRRAVLPARLGVGRQPPPQHVHPDRAGDRNRLPLQPCRRAPPRHLPGILPHRGGWRSALFRGGRGHHDPGAARPGARVARALADQQRDPRAAGPRAKASAPGEGRWHRRRRRARSGCLGPAASGAPGREGAGRRRRRRGSQRGR